MYRKHNYNIGQLRNKKQNFLGGASIYILLLKYKQMNYKDVFILFLFYVSCPLQLLSSLL